MVHAWDMTRMQAVHRQGVFPHLNIDRLLLLCVVMSLVYVLLYNSGPPGKDPQFRKRPAQLKVSRSSTVKSGLNRSSSTRWRHRAEVHDNKKPPGVCPNDVRVSVMRGVCKSNKIYKYEYPSDGDQSLKIVVVDDERKLFYCLIGKAGSKSWLNYMARLTGKADESDMGSYRKDHFLNQIGLRMLRRVPLAELQEKYRDYFKFVVVRHPLQRVVSAYYEVIQKLGKYKGDDGSLMNFRQYVRAVTGKLLDYNPHWRRYHNRCKICHLDYDYVIKTETMEGDTPDFNDVIGAPPDLGVQHMHQNEFLDSEEDDDAEDEEESEIDSYKYDNILAAFQEKYPEEMKALVRVYGDDMSLFGYQWDWDRSRSLCHMKHNHSSCC